MAYSYKDDLDRFNEKKNDSKKLTLNSLNLASDAGLNPTYGGDGSGGGGSGEDLFPEYPVIIEFDAGNAASPADIDNMHARYLKGGYSEIRECPTDGDFFIVLEKILMSGDTAPPIADIGIADDNGVLFSDMGSNIIMYFNSDGTITFGVYGGDQNQ